MSLGNLGKCTIESAGLDRSDIWPGHEYCGVCEWLRWDVVMAIVLRAPLIAPITLRGGSSLVSKRKVERRVEEDSATTGLDRCADISEVPFLCAGMFTYVQRERESVCKRVCAYVHVRAKHRSLAMAIKETPRVVAC